MKRNKVTRSVHHTMQHAPVSTELKQAAAQKFAARQTTPNIVRSENGQVYYPGGTIDLAAIVARDQLAVQLYRQFRQFVAAAG